MFGSEGYKKTIDLTDNTLSIKGSKPDKGTLFFNEEGQIYVVAKYSKYCIEKKYEDKTPKIVEDSICEKEVQKMYREAILNGADPEIKGKLIPVIIESDGVVKKADTKSEWYRYEEKRWANAVILKNNSSKYVENDIIPEENIKQYYVWIPRYRYQLWNVDGEEIYPNGYSKENAINIVFENKDINISSGKENEEWLTHPAFTSFDTNGIWVGKFETSYDEESYTHNSTFNIQNPNYNSTTDGNNILIKPNIRSLTNKTVSEYYTMSREVNNELNSHMMKNSEWGAVAYLTYSLYGKCTTDGCEEVYINNVNTGYSPSLTASFEGQWDVGASITGCSGKSASDGALGNQTVCQENYAWNGVDNKASTTGNITGVYDMSGGIWEYVMGVIKDVSGNPISGMNHLYHSGFNGTYGYPTYGGQSILEHTDGISFPSDYRYYDLYKANSNVLGDDTWWIYSNGHLGDGTKEIAVSRENESVGGSIWFNDIAHFPTNFNPWIGRGGGFTNGNATGVFNFYRDSGTANRNSGFRVVLAY